MLIKQRNVPRSDITAVIVIAVSPGAHMIKSLAVLALLCIWISQTHAQNNDSEPAAPATMIVVNPPPPQTTLEKTDNLIGALIIRGYTNIGVIQTDDGAIVRVLALELKTPGSKENVTGIVIEIQNSGRITRTAVSYIDAEEIDGLSAALDAISKLDRAA